MDDMSSQRESMVTIVTKADVSSAQSNAVQSEDLFAGLYYSTASPGGVVLEPPVSPGRLNSLVESNNTLLPCITAMQVNVDGTGWEIYHEEKTSEDLANDMVAKSLNEFFNEPWPRETFIAQRKKLRYDVEATGNAYLEVIRNQLRKIIMLRVLDVNSMRLCRLSEPVNVFVTMTRDGVEEEILMPTRHRRFVQRLGGTSVYFKEFGVKMDLSKSTGAWSDPELPVTDRATEIIHFRAVETSSQNYGTPRWITQMPSILGSRKAEEMNLAYFDHGGIPPALIVVEGGVFASEARKTLEKYFQNPKAASRAAILEVQSTGGSMLDKGSSVRVQIERFGSEQQKDSLFGGYDQSCEMKIRGSFRLPDLFVGRAASANYATAFASYLATEAQVFRPERDEFDDMINVTIVRELAGDPGYRLRSKQMGSTDIALQLQAIGMVKDRVAGLDLVEAVNRVAGLDLAFDEEGEQLRQQQQQDEVAFNQELSLIKAKQPITPTAGGESTPSRPQAKKSDSDVWSDVVDDVCGCLIGGIGTGPRDLPGILSGLSDAALSEVGLQVAKRLLQDAPHPLVPEFERIIATAMSISKE